MVIPESLVNFSLVGCLYACVKTKHAARIEDEGEGGCNFTPNFINVGVSVLA